MPILRVDWNPSDKKIRQFGVGLVLFCALSGFLMRRQALPAGLHVLGGGIALGVLSALWPAIGRPVYKAWMSIAFVIGTAVSFVILAVFYYAVLTPLAIFFRLRGRDALRLVKPSGETYWAPAASPKDDAYYGRLF